MDRRPDGISVLYLLKRDDLLNYYWTVVPCSWTKELDGSVYVCGEVVGEMFLNLHKINWSEYNLD